MADIEHIPEEAQGFALGEQMPTAEPFTSQVDNNILNIIAFYSMPEMLGLDNPPEPKYPEMRKYIMILTHLHRTANLNREQAISSYFQLKNEVIEMDRSRYAGDDEAQQILDAIEYNCYMIIFGDAEKGKRQGFLARLAGSIREFGMLNRREPNTPWWRRF